MSDIDYWIDYIEESGWDRDGTLSQEQLEMFATILNERYDSKEEINILDELGEWDSEMVDVSNEMVHRLEGGISEASLASEELTIDLDDPIEVTPSDLQQIVDDVRENSGFAEGVPWGDDDVRMAIRNTLPFWSEGEVGEVYTLRELIGIVKRELKGGISEASLARIVAEVVREVLGQDMGGNEGGVPNKGYIYTREQLINNLQTLLDMCWAEDVDCEWVTYQDEVWKQAQTMLRQDGERD